MKKDDEVKKINYKKIVRPVGTNEGIKNMGDYSVSSFCPAECKIRKIILYLRRLVAGISPRKLGFNSRSIPVRFLVGKLAFEQIFSEDFGFPLRHNSIIAPYSCSHLTPMTYSFKN